MTLTWLVYSNIQKVQFLIKNDEENEAEVQGKAYITIYVQNEVLYMKSSCQPERNDHHVQLLHSCEVPGYGVFEYAVLKNPSAHLELNTINFSCGPDRTFILSFRYPVVSFMKSITQCPDLLATYFQSEDRLEKNAIKSLFCTFCKYKLTRNCSCDTEGASNFHLYELPSKSWHELVDAWSCHKHEFGDKFKNIAQDNFILPTEQHQIFISLDQCFVLSEILQTPAPDSPRHEIKRKNSGDNNIECYSCHKKLGHCLNDGKIACLDIFSVHWSVPLSLPTNTIDPFEMALVRQLSYYIQYDCTFSFRLQFQSSSNGKFPPFDFWISHPRLLISNCLSSDCNTPPDAEPLNSCAIPLRPVMLAVTQNSDEKIERKFFINIFSNYFRKESYFWTISFYIFK